MNQLSMNLRWCGPRASCKSATCRLVRPTWSRSPSHRALQPIRLRVELGSASILLAVVGTLPTSGFDFRRRIATRKADQPTGPLRVMYTRGSANPR